MLVSLLPSLDARPSQRLHTPVPYAKSIHTSYARVPQYPHLTSSSPQPSLSPSSPCHSSPSALPQKSSVASLIPHSALLIVTHHLYLSVISSRVWRRIRGRGRLCLGSCISPYIPSPTWESQGKRYGGVLICDQTSSVRAPMNCGVALWFWAIVSWSTIWPIVNQRADLRRWLWLVYHFQFIGKENKYLLILWISVGHISRWLKLSWVYATGDATRTNYWPIGFGWDRHFEHLGRPRKRQEQHIATPRPRIAIEGKRRQERARLVLN